LQEATVALAVMTVAACRAIFERTVEYAKIRVQYERPIGSFQALKHRMANMYLAVERAASVGWYAALTLAEDDPRRAEAVSVAKAAAGECQHLVVGAGLQLHGGIGFTWEHDLHFLLKRAKVGDALFGNALRHRAILAERLGLTASTGVAA
jgi:alkylation response protein AidB-like acyl-CoA dehydrogenase